MAPRPTVGELLLGGRLAELPSDFERFPFDLGKPPPRQREVIYGPTVVYGLVDPRCALPSIDDVRYVGIATDLEVRTYEHLLSACSDHQFLDLKNLWLRRLIVKGMRPVVLVLASSWNREVAARREKKLIHKLARKQLIFNKAAFPDGDVAPVYSKIGWWNCVDWEWWYGDRLQRRKLCVERHRLLLWGLPVSDERTLLLFSWLHDPPESGGRKT